MPRGDRTGPLGMGPMTGRAAGYCAGYGMPGYANPMPGRGFGLGRARGWGGGWDLDAPASSVFGRCPFYLFVDTDTMQCQAVDNPALSATGGAGIQAAQLIIEQGAQAVLTGNVGPNAYNVFRAANVPLYLIGEGTVREAVEAYKAGGGCLQRPMPTFRLMRAWAAAEAGG